jgi:hypothetical protein
MFELNTIEQNREENKMSACGIKGDRNNMYIEKI